MRGRNCAIFIFASLSLGSVCEGIHPLTLLHLVSEKGLIVDPLLEGLHPVGKQTKLSPFVKMLDEHTGIPVCLNRLYTGRHFHCYMLDEFVILGVSGLFCHFYTIFDEQAMKNLIRCHIIWHLIWVCTEERR